MMSTTNTVRTTAQAGFSGRTVERALVPWRQRQKCRSVFTKAQTTSGVRIEVEKTSWTSRRIFASVLVNAPKSCMWGALTDYDNLGTFVPSLVENRCLERTANSAVIYQVGAQDVALGVKFSAAVSLRCTEYFDGGLPASMMTAPQSGISSSSDSNGGSSSEDSSSSESAEAAQVLFPYPLTSAPGVLPSDISFELVEGDFQAFRGIWRMQQLGDLSTLLSYALFVKPQAWLPVALIQGRIENEVVRNLEALRRYAEAQHERQLRQQQALEAR